MGRETPSRRVPGCASRAARSGQAAPGRWAVTQVRSASLPDAPVWPRRDLSLAHEQAESGCLERRSARRFAVHSSTSTLTSFNLPASSRAKRLERLG